MNIEVGEYVRIVQSRRSMISKVYKIEEGKTKLISKKYFCMIKGEEEWFTRADIVNHSKNKIDLVQEGDYVNGMLVEMNYDSYNSETEEYEDILGFSIYDDAQMDSVSEIRPLRTVNIKSIVTKEQFDLSEYIFEEE